MSTSPTPSNRDDDPLRGVQLAGPDDPVVLAFRRWLWCRARGDWRGAHEAVRQLRELGISVVEANSVGKKGRVIR